MTGPTPPPLRLTKAELDALPLYAAVLCVDQKYRRVYLALKVGNPPGTGGHTWRTTDYSTIPDSGRLAADYAVLLDPGLTALVLMGFAQDAALARAAVKAEALIETDQVTNVVHARHEPVVGHSRHDTPRDVPSSAGRPATSSALARATEEVKSLWLHEEVDLAAVAHAALSAALADPDGRLASTVEGAVYAHDVDHDADCVLGECVLAALRAVALGKCPSCGYGGDPRCPRCGSDQ
ncbi:hypothetical protein [Cellulosimicrobium aquatile]|uniref:hypothetical protein n=1 Tax=Cellulosimicrobium aquatile TaxID=1612203 RepID=UPI001459A997|nr:hypothetical protein [Cellulosimicrobium aquatile]NMF27934.1 hypothetical protein [Cellulosimicrobium aquatile]